MPHSRPAFLANIARLFRSDEDADCRIRLSDRLEMPAHLIVLKNSSEYFRTAATTAFPSHRTLFTLEVEKDFQSLHALYRAIQFMYTGTYQDTPFEEELGEDDEDAFIEVNLYFAGRFLVCPELQELMLEKLKEVLPLHVCFRHWDVVLAMAVHIFTYTSASERRIRDVIIRFLHKSLPQFTREEGFAMAINEYPEVNAALLCHIGTIPFYGQLQFTNLGS